MKRTHFIYDKPRMRYFRDVDGRPEATGLTRQQADLYDPRELVRMGVDLYKDDFQPWKVEAIEPNQSEYFTWIARRGGKSKSDKKIAANRRNGNVPKRRFNTHKHHDQQATS